jgi:MoaA/NifB/PqqE/SkfB family radical SAM enzyme
MSRMAATAYKHISEAVNYRLRTFGGGHLANHCRPTSVAALLSERCNARCVHCDIWKNRGKEDSPSVEQWTGVLTDVRRWLEPIQTTLTGGEAMLRPFAIDLVTHGASIGLFMEILTHGYWPDQAKIEKLALANPWRITISLDGLGDTHSKVRGRENFFEVTSTTLRTLQRVRREQDLDFVILLKNVLMEHNLDDAGNVARFAREGGMQVFYQPIEQNYNTPEDVRWFEHGENWPKDPSRAIAVVERLLQLKRTGLPIANSYAQLAAMIPYFRDPDSLRVSTQAHSAHECRQSCAALTSLQIQSNGDVTNCIGCPPVGNVKTDSIRRIWESRPRAWETDCCLQRRCTPAEQKLRLVESGP